MPVRLPTHSNPSHNDTHRQRPLLGEPNAHQRQTGDIQQTRAQPHAQPLAQEDLLVRRAKAQHHDTKHDEEVAHQQHGAEVPQIEKRPGQHADDNEQPGLHGTDPGYRRRRGVAEQRGFVVGLEGAVGQRETPG